MPDPGDLIRRGVQRGQVPKESARVLSHRGASSEAAENTLAAIRRAVDLGADLVEVDVQRSKDGVLVLMHDTTLTRTTDARRVFPDRAPWRVGDLTYSELLHLDAGSWKSPDHAEEAVPTLAQALHVIGDSRTGLLLELKSPRLHPGVVDDVVTTFRDVPGFLDSVVASDRLVVQSFDFTAMKENKTRLPEVPVGLLGTPTRANLPALASWADQVNPNHYSVDSEYVNEVQTESLWQPTPSRSPSTISRSSHRQSPVARPRR